MERTLKTWGEKLIIHRDDLSEVSFLKLKPNYRCSWHYHIGKWNRFYVVDGRLFVKTEDGIATVNPGQFFTVPPLVWHEFQTDKIGASAIEVMYTKYNPEDIRRKNVGGKIDTSA